jgi:hypothetical protein
MFLLVHWVRLEVDRRVDSKKFFASFALEQALTNR